MPMTVQAHAARFGVEAVVLELREATFVPRAVGCAIDYLAYGAGLLLSSFALAETSDALDPAAGRAWVVALAVFWLLAVPTAVETLSRGRSLGRLHLRPRLFRGAGAKTQPLR